MFPEHFVLPEVHWHNKYYFNCLYLILKTRWDMATSGRLVSATAVVTWKVVRAKLLFLFLNIIHFFQSPQKENMSVHLLFFFFFLGCYGFWCCPCLACNVAGKSGENACLPVCDMLSPAIFAACGIPLCVPPAVLTLRSAMRHKYNIEVWGVRQINWTNWT